MKMTTKRTPSLQKPSPNYGRILFTLFLCITLTAMFSTTAFAAGTDVWSKAKDIMQDVYKQILGISTIAAIVTAATALLLMNFFPQWQDGGRIPCVDQTNHHHLGDSKRVRFYHGVCDPVFYRRPVDADHMSGGDAEWAF